MNTTAIENQTIDSDTINLFDVGVLVNLRIKQWSGRKMLTRADLIRVGYDPEKLPSEIVNLGRKLMVPKAEIQALTRVEQRARKALERWSVPFGIANAHFVPDTMLPTVIKQIDGFKEEFFIMVDSFISRFGQLVEIIKQSHTEFWDKCLKDHYPKDPKSLREHYQFQWYTFSIAGIGAIEETAVEDISARQQIRQEREKVLRDKMQSEVGEFVGEYVSAMRGEVVRFCDLMTSRINGQPFEDEEHPKKLTPKSISCFRNYVDRFRQMNIFGDHEVEKMLCDFRSTFLEDGIGPTNFESSGVKSSVTKILKTIREKAAAEGLSGSQFIGSLKRRVVL